MTEVEIACTACACLCDDTRVEIEAGEVVRIENACIKGAALIRAVADPKRRCPSMIRGRKVSFERAFEEADHLLRGAKNPLIFGLDTSTLEAQGLGVELARALGATIDDTSSFCQGGLVEHILKGDLPSCSLTDVRDSSDLMIYWGSNAHHSHPRHLSHYTYYPRDQYSEAGWIPQVTMISVEVRDTETTSLCFPRFIIRPGHDKDLIGRLVETLRGREDTEKEFAEHLRRARFCVIFAGLGLTYGLDNDFSPLIELASEIGRSARVAVIPMVGHFNMRGFNHSLYKATGYVNRVGFSNGVNHGESFSFLGQARDRAPDCLMIVGSDPFSSLPQVVMKNLLDLPIVCLDPFPTATTKAATVVLGTAASGIEVGGHAIRMDGEKVELGSLFDTIRPSDEVILKRLLEGV
ncbi:MAG: formylmethanofuran dehydrogenase subunit B [Thermodesulfobacteriota bacterium]|nr:formylmethanofuran dehydrogenase subunit B [Thermodesulfobacteriota bacterium]